MGAGCTDAFLSGAGGGSLKAEMAGKSIIIEVDANSKLGPDLIPGNKHQQSDNGRILTGVIKRQNLIIGNSLKQCK